MAKQRPKQGLKAEFRVPKSCWSRPTWLRAATVNALIAATVMMSHPAIDEGIRGALLRQAAQVQLVHAMGTIACATFMNMGAATAARAPLLFMLGTILYCGPAYASWPEGHWFTIIHAAACLSLLAGWLTLIWSASEVDRAERGHRDRNCSTSNDRSPQRGGAKFLGDRLRNAPRRD